MKLKTKIGVVSMLALNLSAMVVGSAIAAISQAFPDVPISTVQLLTTLPGLGTLLLTLVVGQLAMKVSKKTLVLIGVAMTTLGGLLPAVWHQSMGGLLLCSLLLGAGLGFTTTVNPMLVSEYFEGEEQSTVLGIGTGVTSLGGMFMMAVGGVLGASEWFHLYWVYSLGIIVFLLVWFCLPNDRVAVDEVSHVQEKSSVLKLIGQLNPYTLVVYVAVFALVLSYNAYMANLSLVIVSSGVGGTAEAGVINAVGTLGGVVAGFGFAVIRKVTKPNTLALGLVSVFLALGLTYIATNVLLFSVAGVLAAIGMVAVMASAPFLLAMLSKPQHIPVVMSIYAFINGLAGALAPKLISWLGIPVGLPSIMFASGVCVVVAVVLLVMKFGKNTESGALLQAD